MSTIKTGDRLPSAPVLKKGADGLEPVDLSAITGRVALFAVPGAFTGTCSSRHVPSFIEAAPALREKGVDRIIGITVNDPSVTDAWLKATGADAAGIEILSDADGSFTRAMGMAFDAPQFGMYGRSKRYSAVIRDGVIEALNIEDSPGGFAVSGGDHLLTQL